MIRRRKNGFIQMLFLTILIILGSFFGIYFLGLANEKYILTQEIALSSITPIECNLTDITYPWEIPDNLLTPETRFPTHPNRDYLESLKILAEDIGGHISVETTNLWRDVDGLLIHKGEKEHSLSYAIDTKKGQIVGYGIKPLTITSASEKQQNTQDIRSLLLASNYLTPYISEAHLLKAFIDNSLLHLQPLGKYNQITNYETLNYFQHVNILQDWTNEINALSYEVCYYRNVLSIVCYDENPLYLLQCDPLSQKITSGLLLR